MNRPANHPDVTRPTSAYLSRHPRALGDVIRELASEFLDPRTAPARKAELEERLRRLRAVRAAGATR